MIIRCEENPPPQPSLCYPLCPPPYPGFGSTSPPGYFSAAPCAPLCPRPCPYPQPQVIVQDCEIVPDHNDLSYNISKGPNDGRMRLRIPEDLEHNTTINIETSPEYIPDRNPNQAGAFATSILNGLFGDPGRKNCFSFSC